MAKKQKQAHQRTRAAMVGTHAKSASSTKAGPGRFHAQGHEKASPPNPHGAGADFVLHKASAEKRDRRARIATYGRRIGIKVIKAEQRVAAKMRREIERAAISA